jgi:hypothetical protein
VHHSSDDDDNKVRLDDVASLRRNRNVTMFSLFPLEVRSATQCTVCD